MAEPPPNSSAQPGKYDIFVSYAHVDNAEEFGEEGWVSTLVKNLRVQINKKMGRTDSVSIWWDHTNLKGYHSITPEIHEKVQDSSILLLILSPGYLTSKWCQDEMALFLKALQNGSQKRVFVIDQHPINEDQSMPPELADLLGYRFWCRDDKQRIRTMTIHDSESQKNDYIRLVQDLAADLSDQLKVIDQQTPSSPKAPKARVYLAEVTEDLGTRRDQVRRYLEDAQIDVLPSRRYLEGQAFKDALNEDLPQCSLFIQLLGEVAGRTPPEIPQGYSRLQLEQAQSSTLAIFQWRDPNMLVNQVKPSEHRKLLTAETVYAEPLETFKARVVKAATTPEPPDPPATSVESSPFVLINAEKRDRPLAETIRDQLDPRLLRALPEYEGQPKKIRKNLEEKLVECDALIVVYGKAPVDWVDSQILQCNRVKPKRQQPLRILGIYDGPPKKKPAVSIRLQGMEILPFREGLDQQRLNDFLAPLLAGGSDDQ